MLKIQNVGIGSYIRSPRGRHGVDSRQSNIEVWQVSRNDGNSFLCFPVTDAKTVPVTLDTTRYWYVPLDTMVDKVSI